MLGPEQYLGAIHHPQAQPTRTLDSVVVVTPSPETCSAAIRASRATGQYWSRINPPRRRPKTLLILKSCAMSWLQNLSTLMMATCLPSANEQPACSQAVSSDRLQALLDVRARLPGLPGLLGGRHAHVGPPSTTRQDAYHVIGQQSSLATPLRHPRTLSMVETVPGQSRPPRCDRRLVTARTQPGPATAEPQLRATDSRVPSHYEVIGQVERQRIAGFSSHQFEAPTLLAEGERG